MQLDKLAAAFGRSKIESESSPHIHLPAPWLSDWKSETLNKTSSGPPSLPLYTLYALPLYVLLLEHIRQWPGEKTLKLHLTDLS